MRLIDADVLLNNTDGLEHVKYSQEYGHVVLVCDIVYAPTIDVPKWIAVTERLPKPNEEDEDGIQRRYLIQTTFSDNGMMVAASRGNNSGDTWWEEIYSYKPLRAKVVAWMPLPEPYREETT